MRRRNPIRVWRDRGWCWVCRARGGPEYGWVVETEEWPCDGKGGYRSVAEAADAGRRHLREFHGAEAAR